MKTKVFRTATTIMCLALSVSFMFAQNNDSPLSISLPKKIESGSQNTNSAQSVQLVMGIKSGISESSYSSYIYNRYENNLEKRRIPGAKKKASNDSYIKNYGENGYTTNYEDSELYYSPVEGDITRQSDGKLYYCLQGGDKLYKFKIEPCFFEGALYQVSLKCEYILKSANAKDIVSKMNKGFTNNGYSAQKSNRDNVTVFVKNNVKATVTLKSEGILGTSVYIDYADVRMAEKKDKADKAKKDAEAVRQKEIESRSNQHKEESSKSVSRDLF